MIGRMRHKCFPGDSEFYRPGLFRIADTRPFGPINRRFLKRPPKLHSKIKYRKISLIGVAKPLIVKSLSYRVPFHIKKRNNYRFGRQAVKIPVRSFSVYPAQGEIFLRLHSVKGQIVDHSISDDADPLFPLLLNAPIHPILKLLPPQLPLVPDPRSPGPLTDFLQHFGF
ncbi:MAG: hypothetical protein BWY42_01184 [Candidatus Omnitrophica bacterium ADurb.Bin277]|nr:MAG: hypothetical protein BWY42_01184 [Candidatus Omnitrophica bacterium ADurb.Bin277]